MQPSPTTQEERHSKQPLGAVEADPDFDMAESEEGPVQRTGALIHQTNRYHANQTRGLLGMLVVWNRALESLEGLVGILPVKSILMIEPDYSIPIYLEALRDWKAGIRTTTATARSALLREPKAEEPHRRLGLRGRR